MIFINIIYGEYLVNHGESGYNLAEEFTNFSRAFRVLIQGGAADPALASQPLSVK